MALGSAGGVEMVGAGLIVSVTGAEIAEGPFATVIDTDAGLIMIPAFTIAVHCVDEQLLERDAVFHCTVEKTWKVGPFAFTVSVNPGPVAVTAVGEIPEMDGPRIVNVAGADTVGPGFSTVTATAPGVASRELGISAVRRFPF